MTPQQLQQAAEERYPIMTEEEWKVDHPFADYGIYFSASNKLRSTFIAGYQLALSQSGEGEVDDNKIRYVVGFMFDQKSYGVLLIEKQTPEWQKGLLNGIGGKIEKGENSLQAMQREFKEETGIDQYYWQNVITMNGEGWEVVVYTCKSNKVHEAETTEAEKVMYIPITELDSYAHITNLQWLIPMCLDRQEINYEIRNTYIK